MRAGSADRRRTSVRTLHAFVSCSLLLGALADPRDASSRDGTGRIGARDSSGNTGAEQIPALDSGTRALAPAAGWKDRATLAAARKRAAGGVSRDLSGGWDCILFLPTGELKLVLRLVQEGNEITGTLGADIGTVAIRDVMLEGDTLRFQVDLLGNAYRFEGTLEDRTLTGTWFASGAWKGTRHRDGKASPAVP